jgi:thiamine pyrophosphokinase
MNHHALIICNGPLPAKSVLQSLTADAALVICADGGANRALRRGLKPHVIIGDFDSLAPDTAAAFPGVQIIQVPDQYSTDLEKALDYALSQKVSSAVVVGATGRRPDHTVANFSILAKYHQRLDLMLVDSYCRIRLIDHDITLQLPMGMTISLMPLGLCQGITTTGLAYPLSDESLQPGVREGLSNRVVASPVRIQVRDGLLLLFEVLKP